MSLFGTSPEQPTSVAKSRLSLFDDEPSPAPGSKSSLFADDDSTSGSHPWALPIPKITEKRELVKSLLPTSSIPDSYVDIYDSVMRGEDGAVGKITASGVIKVLSAAGLGADQQSRIISIVGSEDLTRSEFNVLLALIGLAQEHEDVSLDGVDERRKNLPVPHLPALASEVKINSSTEHLAAKPPQNPNNPSPNPVSVSPAKPRNVGKNNLDFEADPWGSPAMHTGHLHEEDSSKPQSQPSSDLQRPVRTTSTFTTSSNTGSNGIQSAASEERPPTAGVWGSYNANSSASFADSGISTAGPKGFGVSNGESREGPPADIPSRSFGGGRVSVGGVEENIVISLLPEKEGMFMFQHRNYHVSSVRRGSKVVRRYSDFVWLLDCLHKRFPFRQLPLLPPKRVGVNGNHLAADNTFIEKRRRGLSRFANALVRHPVLSQEQLVIMFLTVPTELSVWRKQATISVQEEFVDRPLPPGLEDSLSPSLNDLFERTRSGVRMSVEVYINICNLMDRLAKRNEGVAADHLRLSNSLQSLIQASEDTYATDTNDVPLLNEGLNATAKHLSSAQSLLEDEAKAWDQGVLEDLKRQRDALVSMRDMFDRRDRYDKDNIPQLERRIQNNETKLVSIRGKPDGMVKPGEIEKVTEAIIKDKESIVAQHARGVFIKECIRDELNYFQHTQYHVSRWNQDWAQERVKYSELQADSWKQLHEELESMPLGD